MMILLNEGQTFKSDYYSYFIRTVVDIINMKRVALVIRYSY